MLRHYKLYKQEINKIKKSQGFMSTNFDQAFKSIKELKEENIELHKEDKSLQTWVDELDNNIIANEQEVESISSTFDVIQLYVRLSWNPSIRRWSNTSDRPQGSTICQSWAPSSRWRHFHQSSTAVKGRNHSSNHCEILPKRYERQTLQCKRKFSTKTAKDLSFLHNNKLYINESLTPKLRDLLYEGETRNNPFKNHCLRKPGRGERHQAK